jgi:hypothetical protein
VTAAVGCPNSAASGCRRQRVWRCRWRLILRRQAEDGGTPSSRALQHRRPLRRAHHAAIPPQSTRGRMSRCRLPRR